MSEVRNRLERQRLERLEAAKKGPAPKVAMPEQPAVFRDYSRQNIEDAAILRPDGPSNSPRARMEPRLAPAPTPTPLSPDQILWQRGVEEQRRHNEAAARARGAEAQRQRQVQVESQRAAAVEAERLRVAGADFESATNELRIEGLLGNLTLADAAVVEQAVHQQFGKTNDPAAYELVIRERQREADGRKVLATAPVDVLDSMTDKDLGDFLGVSTTTAATLRGEI